MKDATNALAEYLNSQKNLTSCDIYELTLNNGNVYRFADFDTDVSYNGNVYSHSAIGMPKRQQINIKSQATVDSMNIQIYSDANDMIESVRVNKAAHDGLLDRATLALSRCFFASNGNVIGAIKLFAGIVEIHQCGGLSLQLTVKSKTQGLNMEFPVRKYYPQGIYNTVGDTVTSSTDDSETCLITPFVPLKEVLM